MALKEETKQFLEFHKSLSDGQVVQFMGVPANITMHGNEFVNAGVNTLLAYELKLPPKEKD